MYSNSTSLLFLENIMKTILKCTKHNVTKEVIVYKMTRVLSSQHLSWSESHIYCSTAHHS